MGDNVRHALDLFFYQFERGNPEFRLRAYWVGVEGFVLIILSKKKKQTNTAAENEEYQTVHFLKRL